MPRVVSGVPVAKNEQTRTLDRFVHINPPGANDSRYAYVPFDVPPGVVRVHVSYQYDRAGGANTIDIGLFDARSSGSDTDARGFRGWSGGRRSEFAVSRDEATPGYLPGAMPAGTWRIILGLYKIAPTGVDVSFKIGIETADNRSSGPTSAPRPATISSASAPVTITAAANGTRRTAVLPQRIAGRGSRWWRGDLHMHTVHSDGEWTIPELINSALNVGLDFISVTDHNTASHHAEIDSLRNGSTQLLVLRGEEITTYGGHTNAWGLPSMTWIDFRTHPGDNTRISNIAAEAHRAGAVISINHPFALCGGCNWSYDMAARDFDGIEVWNGAWDITDEQALMMWDKILQSGRPITAIASSDSHRLGTPIGLPTTHVAANDLSQVALLNAIRQGHVYLTGEAAQPVVSFEAEVVTGTRRARSISGDEIRLSAPGTIRFFITAEAAPPDAMISLISNGNVLRRLTAAPDARPQVVEIECRQDSYFRLEVRDKAGMMLALTNPIYVKVGTDKR
ncbi:MAG: CehA/McbA family metallohydrolase [Pyrinomonadaceae bacterium]